MDEDNKPNSNNSDESTPQSKKSSKIKKAGQEVAKQQATKVVGKTIEGSKIAAGGTGTPAGSIVSGVTEAGQAIKNKDAMGVADAGVKTGAVLGATALGGAAAGAVTEKLLNTKIGKKTTRLTSRLLIISIVAPFLAMVLLIAIIGGIVGGIVGNTGQQAGGLFDPCIKGSVLAITDGPTVQILTPIVKSADSVNKAVTGVMVYLSGDFNSSSNLTTSVKALYKEIDKRGLFNTPHASGGGKISGGIVSSSSYNAPWEVAYYAQNPKVSKTSSPSPEQLSLEQSYAAVYSRAYWTVNTMIIRDPSLGKGMAGSDQLSNYDDTIDATQFLTGVAVPSCQPTGAHDGNGLITTPGTQVQSFNNTKTVTLDIIGATVNAKTHVITYKGINTLSVGDKVTISGLSQSLFNIKDAIVLTETPTTFSVQDTSNTSTTLSLSGESGVGIAQVIPRLPAKYNSTAAVAKALTYIYNAPPVGPPTLAAGNCLTLGCETDCDHLAGLIWGYRNSGYPTAAGPPTNHILSHWDTMLTSNFAHPNDLNPPVGALLFWIQRDNPKGEGHVAVYIGKFFDPGTKKMQDYVVSNWTGDHGVTIYKITISQVASDTRNHFNYLGWSEPIFNSTLL